MKVIRKTVAVAMLSLFGLLAHASADENSRTEPIAPGNLIVQVEGETLSFNDRAIPLPGDRKAVVELLGEPSRVLNLANTLLVWDDFGIVVYEDPKSKKIKVVAVALANVKFEFWPRKLFQGKLTLDGAPIAADTTIEAINRQKKGKRLGPDQLGLHSLIEHENVYVTIQKAKDGELDPEGGIAEFAIETKHEEQ